MNYGLKVTFCIAVFLLGYSSASLKAEETNKAVWVAAVDSLDGPPPCGQDKICNLAVCPNDPDCPKNLPGNTDSGNTDSPNRPSDIDDCTSQEVTEIGLAIDWGAANWSTFEAVLEDIGDWPVSIGNCLENRFKENGKVVCEKSMNGNCKGANGWASALNKKCHMCPDFLARVRALNGVANRQACYFALYTHESGHTCERGHKVLEILDGEAFNFWKSKHSDVTISFGGCGMQ